MAQRDSGYARIDRDAYETPPWVTTVLAEWLVSNGVLGLDARVWEPAAGSGKMVRALRSAGFEVVATDIARHDGLDTVMDFLNPTLAIGRFDAIITNPPYKDAERFVRTALGAPNVDVVAMLLPLAWDSAKTRCDLFRDHRSFVAKLTLTSRITWFEHEPAPGEKEHGPSEHHAWFVWDHINASRERPTIDWLDMPEAEAKALAARKRARRLSATRAAAKPDEVPA
jgi:hypothetical protein